MTRGGYREGSGRKPAGTVLTALRLLISDKAKLERLAKRMGISQAAAVGMALAAWERELRSSRKQSS